MREITFQFLKKWKLASPAQMLYKYNTLLISNSVFPEWKIKGWELRAVPPYFWNEHTIKEAIRYYVLEEMKWSREDLISKYTAGELKSTRYQEAMVQFRQQGLYRNLGRNRSSSFALLLYCFPELNLRIWEFDSTMENWDIEDIRSTLEYLFIEKLGWTEDEIKTNINQKVFHENGFKQFFTTFFRGSTYRVMMFLFPHENWDHLKRNENKKFLNKPNYSMIIRGSR